MTWIEGIGHPDYPFYSFSNISSLSEICYTFISFSINKNVIYEGNEYHPCKETDINDQNVSSISVYPTPCDRDLFIDGKNIGVEIYDLQGQLIFENRNSINKIDLKNYNSGIYLLKIKINSYENIFKKIIKN